MKKIQIFYSWQSDLPPKTNRSGIRNGLLKVAADNSNDDYEISIDEATRDEPGSPHIPTTILKKISASDVFVADISTINKGDASRKCPNPNVIFELGYAVSILGWSRIIIIVNDCYTDIKQDVPFDIDRNRILTYSIAFDTTLTNKQIKDNIAKILEPQVQTIIDKNPVKNHEIAKLTPEQIKRDRDVKNIIWILETLHLPTLQEHWEDGPRYLNNRTLFFWFDYEGVFRNKLFQIHDKNIYKVFNELYDELDVSVSGNYHPTTNSERMVWANHMDMPFDSEDEEKRWDLSIKAHRKLPLIIDKIKRILAMSYIEINIEDTSRTAWVKYVDFKKKMKERF